MTYVPENGEYPPPRPRTGQLMIPGIPVPPWHPDAVLEHWEDPLDRIDAIESPTPMNRQFYGRTCPLRVKCKGVRVCTCGVDNR